MLPGSKIRLAEALMSNPWIAEYADELKIREAKDNEGLRRLISGRHMPGECAVLGDVALAKQSTGGLWLALKSDGEEWHGFESFMAGHMASDDPERFDVLVDSMRSASTEQCRRLQYRPLSERAEAARSAGGSRRAETPTQTIGEER